MKQVVIPCSVIEISENAFMSCPSLERVIIPSSVKTIGDCAFSGCFVLSKIVFESPSNLESIGNSVFQFNRKIVEIKLLVKFTRAIIRNYKYA